jgi:hypothetical protein
MKRSRRGEKKPRRRRKGAEEQERKAKNDKGRSPSSPIKLLGKLPSCFLFLLVHGTW